MKDFSKSLVLITYRQERLALLIGWDCHSSWNSQITEFILFILLLTLYQIPWVASNPFSLNEVRDCGMMSMICTVIHLIQQQYLRSATDEMSWLTPCWRISISPMMRKQSILSSWRIWTKNRKAFVKCSVSSIAFEDFLWKLIQNVVSSGDQLNHLDQTDQFLFADGYAADLQFQQRVNSLISQVCQIKLLTSKVDMFNHDWESLFLCVDGRESSNVRQELMSSLHSKRCWTFSQIIQLWSVQFIVGLKEDVTVWC